MTPRQSSGPGSQLVLDAVANLCEVLWQERDLLEGLQFRLHEQLCLLESNETRWIRLADEDIRAAVTLVKDCEVLRAMEVQVVARALDLPADATLKELATASPEPWASLLHDHHRALVAIAEGVRQAIARTRQVIRDGSAAPFAGPASVSGGDDDGC